MPHRNIFRIGFWCLVFAFSSAVGGDFESPIYGHISSEEWAQEAPESYPGAKAVILFDYGRGDYHTGTSERHIRIKILKKDGAENATSVEIPLFPGDKLKALKAQTILPDGQTFEVLEFFEKKAEDIKIKTFAFASVQDGCIVEYQYSLERKQFGLAPWFFQNLLFTLKSTVIVDYDDSRYFNPVYVHIPETVLNAWSVLCCGLNGRRYSKVMEMDNLLPVEEEPLMGGRKDNIASILFYENSYSEWVRWRSIGYWISEAIDKENKSSRSAIKKVSDSICRDLTGREEKIEHLYDYVANNIATTDNDELTEKLADIMKKGRGQATEKNILLVELLKAQDIPAMPLLIGSRKEHEKLYTEIKSLHQFDRTICLIRYGDLSYLLDPGARNSVFPYPAADDLTNGGLMINGEVSGLYEIRPITRVNGVDLWSTIYVDETGNAVCSTTIAAKGFSTERWRERQLDSLTDIAIARKLLDNLETDYEILSASLVEEREKDRYLFNFVLEIRNFASIVDSHVFFTPSFLPVIDNPFVSESRNFPINFNYSFRNRHQIWVILPPNVLVADVPRNFYHAIPDGHFVRRTVYENNEVRVESELEIGRQSYPVSLYGEIREMFNVISQSCLDQVVALTVTDMPEEP